MVLSSPIDPWVDDEPEFGRTNDARPETYEAEDEEIAILGVEIEDVDDERAEATYPSGVLGSGTQVDESGDQEHVLEVE